MAYTRGDTLEEKIKRLKEAISVKINQKKIAKTAKNIEKALGKERPATAMAISQAKISILAKSERANQELIRRTENYQGSRFLS